MTLSSTQFTINYRTGPMSRPELVPGYLRRDFDPARLQAWLVWCVAWVMTVEWMTEQVRGAFDNAVFAAVWAAVLLCVGWLQVKYYFTGENYGGNLV